MSLVKSQLIEALKYLASGFIGAPKLSDGVAEAWLHDLKALNIEHTDLTQAVEVLRRKMTSFPRTVAPIVEQAIKHRNTRLDYERRVEKEEENQPFRAKTVDGTPIGQIAGKVAKALRHDEAARKELGWEVQPARQEQS